MNQTPKNSNPPKQTAPNNNTKEETAASSQTAGSNVEANRNDNSNPQQGSVAAAKNSGSVTINNNGESKRDSNPSVDNEASPTRRSLLSIPPFKKDNRKLFVGGLPSDITDAEFRAFFEQFGELVDSVVMFDYDTHRSRGFGFVSFKDPKVASHMLTLGRDPNDESTPQTGRIQMRDKIVEIKAAEPKEGRNYRMSNQRRSQNNQPPHAYNKNYGYYPRPSQPNGYPPHYYGAPPNAGEGAVTGPPPHATYPPMIPPYYYPQQGVFMAPGYYAPAPAAATMPGQYGYPDSGAVAPLPPQAPVPASYPAVDGTPAGAGVPFAYVPVAQPPLFVPASVMQPAAPGIPTKPGDEQAPENASNQG